MKQFVEVKLKDKVVGCAEYWFEDDKLNYRIISLDDDISGELSIGPVTKDIETIDIKIGVEK